MDILTLIEDQLGQILADTVDAGALRTLEAGAFPDDLWASVEALGLSHALLPESADGAGLGWSAVHRIAALVGSHAGALPVAETMVTARLLHEAGIAVPAGPLAFSDAVSDDTGRIRNVPWGGLVHLLVATADGVKLLPTGAAKRSALSIGRELHADIAIGEATPVASAPTNRLDRDHLRQLGAMLRASAMAGALQRVLAMSVDYANQRQQFGRPIGKFQAIQQSLAQLAAETAAADVAAASAWRALDRAGPDAPESHVAAAVAKIRCGAAARLGAAIAHQVHGAIGVTDEHMLHYFTRRLWSWRQEFGTDNEWAEELGRAVLAGGGASVWPTLTGVP